MLRTIRYAARRFSPTPLGGPDRRTVILEHIAQELVPLVIAGVFSGTGDVLLWLLTAGRRKIDWARFVRDQPRYTVFTDVAAYIGAAFWVAVIWGVSLWAK